jgi:8-oxo-dGTP pyrophosphatase MutT (NUDIX family)
MRSGKYKNPLDAWLKKEEIDECGRLKVAGGAGLASKTPVIIEIMFVFYVLMGGNPFFIVLANSSPIIEHRSAHTSLDDAALECLIARGLVRAGTKKPTNLTSANEVFGHMSITFFQLNETDLVSSSSFLSKKIFSFVNPSTGESRKKKARIISGFGVTEYNTLLSILLSLSPSKPSLALGGGGGAVAGGRAGAVGGGPAASVSDRSRLTQVPKMNPDVVVNAFVLLFFANPRGGILLVKTRLDQCWGLPGGKVDVGEVPWSAGKREFKEETQSDLPCLDGSDFGTKPNEPIKFEWKHKKSSTGIYCGKTDAIFSDFQSRFTPNREISEISVFTPQQIFQMALDLDPINRLRGCAKKSTITILLHLRLIV